MFRPLLRRAVLRCIPRVVLLVVTWQLVATSRAASPDFETQIAPMLVKRCLECHQGDDPAGGLRMTTREELMAGGDSGDVVDLEDVANSYLVRRIVDGEMPPKKQGKSQRMPDDEVALLQHWLAGGAPWPSHRKLNWFERTTDTRAGRDWWSLQPIRKPKVPRLPGEVQPGNPIDAFILNELSRRGMTAAPRADARTLRRRVSYDLLGLPPQPGQMEAWLADPSRDAWMRVVDELLAKPQYGERWGRYWLDLARYADTSGYERDQEKPFAWRYRDWVVSAFNHDMPFEQFIVEQLAGDEIERRTEQSVIATGFLRLGTWNDEPNTPEDYQYDRLEDLVHTTSSAFLGLTVKCARCHAHKFDPITQEDYYRMASAFWAGPLAARDSKFLGGPSPEELGFPEVLGWTDLTAHPAALQVLKHGERDKPLYPVVPASLSSIPRLERTFAAPPPTARTSARRLQLARWIADPRNPLTARVLVNRLWQHHFGQALVRTPNNLGFLADPPTHPALLDWLAAEFLEHGGRIKHVHRLILGSNTWAQSSLHPRHEDYATRDPSNRLWWRAERRRLDAEALRDSLLATAGELDLSVGGASFKPTISREALEGLSQKSAAWTASPARDQQRRSVYMYLKRGLLPPMMTTFDLCDATQSCGQRDSTTVPTQALALLNNPFVHDRSQQLATMICADTPETTSQVRQAWMRVLQRPPSTKELEWSLRHVALQTQTFAASESSRLRDGAAVRVTDGQGVSHGAEPPSVAAPNAISRGTPEFLAFVSLCHALMNSNEFLYVD